MQAPLLLRASCNVVASPRASPAMGAAWCKKYSNHERPPGSAADEGSPCSSFSSANSEDVQSKKMVKVAGPAGAADLIVGSMWEIKDGLHAGKHGHVRNVTKKMVDIEIAGIYKPVRVMKTSLGGAWTLEIGDVVDIKRGNYKGQHGHVRKVTEQMVLVDIAGIDSPVRVMQTSLGGVWPNKIGLEVGRNGEEESGVCSL